RSATVASGDSDWSGQIEVKKFDVEVTLQTDAGQELKPGISAKAEIMVETRPQVLFVPLQSVFADAGGHWCHVATAAGPLPRKIAIGAANDSYVEIVDGLADGDSVLLYNPSLPQGDRGAAQAKPAAAPDAATTAPPPPATPP